MPAMLVSVFILKRDSFQGLKSCKQNTSYQKGFREELPRKEASKHSFSRLAEEWREKCVEWYKIS